MTNDGVKVIQCSDQKEASKKALNFLMKSVDQDTLLFLSGGSSPKFLYQMIAQNKELKPGAVALVDERFGPPFHINSNEKMIKDMGLVDYLNNEGIPFYGILQNRDLEETAIVYEKRIKELMKKFSKKVAIMGIGADGHTAGIKPGLGYNHKKLVIAYSGNDSFGSRITLTYEALFCINDFFVLIFGLTKKDILLNLLTGVQKNNLPASFYTKTQAQVFLFTDVNF